MCFPFFLEVEHCNYCYDLGYDVISHISNEDLICDSIPNFHGSKGKSFSMPLKHGKILFERIGNFRDYCKEYFCTYFQEIMKQDVLSLPYVDKNSFDRNSILKEPFCTIMVTMKDWCYNNQIEENIKGLVIYGYSLDSHLKHCKYPVSILRDDYYNTLLEEKDNTVIVYNPAEKVILFIKIAKTQNLEYEMKLSTSDLIKFMVIYNAILEKSGIKLINLLVIEKELDYKWNCEKCKFQVITLQFLRSQELFEKWWKEREIYFGKHFAHRNISNSFSLDFCANILGFLAGLQYIKGSNFQGMLPSLTNKKHKQMKEAQLLSLERLRIVHSSPNNVKHLKVKGCYGSVMSTVAREMMGFKLKKDEIMYYVMEDPRSQPVPEMEFISNEENKKVVYHNNTVKLSKILNKLIMDNKSKKKIHIMAVECDSEQLDKAEALELNGMLTRNEKLKDSTAFLFFQSVEKKRIEDDKEKESNMFAELKIREEVLVYNMRNSVEINDLVSYTIDGLTKQPSDQTTTFYLTDSDSAEQSNQTETSNETIANDSKDQVKKKKKSKKRGETKGQAPSVMKPRTTKGVNYRSHPEASDAIKKLTLDETFEYSVPSKTRAGKKIVSTFKHMKPIKCGHNITCEIPSLFEINYSESTAEFKILLIFILKRIITKSCQYRRVYDIERLEDLLNIPKNMKRYVILHFDSRNCIPEVLDNAFNLMKIRHLVTSDYEEFKGGKDWIFFVCSYRAFRGHDYSRVILVLHPSMYYLKHFIPECLSRCNTYLRIIILNSVNHVVNRNPSEILRTIIDTWKSPKDGILRVNVWDIELCDTTKQKYSDKSQPEDRDTRKKIKIQISSNLYIDLKKKLEKLATVPGENK